MLREALAAAPGDLRAGMVASGITGSVAEAFYGGVPAAIEREALARLDDPLRDVVKRFRERFMRL